MSDLSAYVRAKRREKGHSLRDAEALSGISASTLSRIERDKGTNDNDIMRKLAAYCGVSYVDLVLMEDVDPQMSDEETDAYLVAHGYNLEELRQEINALIDELRNAAKTILAHKEQSHE
jgi:transcriptional regulator with XRE-family HTH domain